ncbi:Hypothetical protein SRAE_2000429000 [Strongyloides ratti]|uniref:Uncharacterized protein n=1 Tax=Strongyloides ratti TaxID=34506 RepID=A0A090LIS7_STRRB|nr:Hypothetical protein SRAE_2000429000 [Strongyloides ratti]CEF69643.1 Hypothetical protein SRAE_2000429000 [Strongyloides ratti]
MNNLFKLILVLLLIFEFPYESKAVERLFGVPLDFSLNLRNIFSKLRKRNRHNRRKNKKTTTTMATTTSTLTTTSMMIETSTAPTDFPYVDEFDPCNEILF